MGARRNNEPIITNFNRLGPCTKIFICASFQDVSFKIVTCTLRTKFTWTTSQPSRRTDIAKSTQKVILNRTIYFKVQRIFSLCYKHPHKRIIYGGVWYKKYRSYIRLSQVTNDIYILFFPFVTKFFQMNVAYHMTKYRP